MIGPALGSFLYTIGGFTLPFFVVGSISLMLGVCLCLVIPDIGSNPIEEFNNNAKDDKEKKNQENLSFLTIIKVIIASLELS